jgi:8-oxo-dGTP diphosphatase
LDQVPTIRVAAAIIRDARKFLLTLRGGGRHGAGFWEFPGGKIEQGESVPEALAREVLEELGIVIDVGPLFRTIAHRYDDRRVELEVHEAEWVSGDPQALDVAGFGWVLPEEMPGLPILPADLPVVEALRARATAGEGAS